MSSNMQTPPLRHRLDRRCFSTPASPSPILHSPTSTAPVRRSSRRRSDRRRPRPTPAWEWSGSEDSDSGSTQGQVLPGAHPGRRAHHNVLERRRRDHLKSSFEALRAIVPGSPSDVRIPKVFYLFVNSSYLYFI